VRAPALVSSGISPAAGLRFAMLRESMLRPSILTAAALSARRSFLASRTVMIQSLSPVERVYAGSRWQPSVRERSFSRRSC